MEEAPSVGAGTTADIAAMENNTKLLAAAPSIGAATEGKLTEAFGANVAVASASAASVAAGKSSRSPTAASIAAEGASSEVAVDHDSLSHLRRWHFKLNKYNKVK